MEVGENRKNKQWKELIECRQPLNNFSPRFFFFFLFLSLSTAASCTCPWTLIVDCDWSLGHGQITCLSAASTPVFDSFERTMEFFIDIAIASKP
jgi:hypothetical protein